jgi:hypothetical protein
MFFPFTKKLNYIKLQLLLRYYFLLFLSIIKITLNRYFRLKNITFMCVYTYFNLLYRESLFFQPQKTKKSDQHNFYVNHSLLHSPAKELYSITFQPISKDYLQKFPSLIIKISSPSSVTPTISKSFVPTIKSS